MMTGESTIRFGAQTDEVTSLLRVVNLVRTGEATTRPEISRLTGLGRGVVTQRVEQAIEMGFLADSEFAPSTGGRAARTLRFQVEQGRIVVCAFGALHIRVGLADLGGELIDHAQRSWDIAAGPSRSLETALSMIAELIGHNPAVPVWAVAVGLPGPVDFESGKPVAPPIMPGWNGFDVRTWFASRLDAPVWVDNDVNLLTFSERKRRRGENADLIYCKIGYGIGAGLLSKGRLHRGANGAAGDIGHVRVPDSTAQCRCGKIGCLEAVAGGWAIVRDAEAAIAEGGTGLLAKRVREEKAPLTPEIVARAAEDGDALAITLIQQSARRVGESISTMVNLFNPATIVIGGAAAASGELYLAEVRQRVYELSVPLATRDLVISTSVDDEREPLRGGAELAREELFDVSFPRWFANSRPTIQAVHGATAGPSIATDAA